MAEPRATRVLADPGRLPRPFGGTPGTPGAGPLELAREQGRQAGLAEGRRLAEDELAGEIRSRREELARALEHLARRYEELERRHRVLIVELALEAASRIVRERIAAGDPLATRALEQALAALPNAGPFRARVHPDDLEGLREALGPERGEIELAADAEIERGGCVVDCEAGTVDARLETALAAVRSAAEGRPEAP